MAGRLLLVDDEAEVLDVLVEYLSSRGHAVTSARTGADAIDALDTPFDAAVIDWTLPDRSCREVIHALRSRQPACPVLLTTGHGSENLKLEDLSFRVAGVLRKPFTMRALAARIEALIPGGLTSS